MSRLRTVFGPALNRWLRLTRVRVFSQVVFFALFVHFLELLVAFLQAYIFTMLTAQFISMSVHPAH